MFDDGLTVEWRVRVLKLALCALSQGLGSEETLSEALFESILLPIWYVLVLQQAVKTSNFNTFVSCQEPLQYKVGRSAVFTKWKHNFTLITHLLLRRTEFVR